MAPCSNTATDMFEYVFAFSGNNESNKAQLKEQI